MVVGPDGEVGSAIHLPNIATKNSDVIPLNKQLRANLIQLLGQAKTDKFFKIEDSFGDNRKVDSDVGASRRNMFKRWYHDIGLLGCSSHSGRRTFITNAARKIGTVGGSLRMSNVGRAQFTVCYQAYINDGETQRALVSIL